MDTRLIYTFNILNQSDHDLKGILLDIIIGDELCFVKGSIKRERGMMDIETGCKDLIIGNLSPNEEAEITIELKAKK